MRYLFLLAVFCLTKYNIYSQVKAEIFGDYTIHGQEFELFVCFDQPVIGLETQDFQVTNAILNDLSGKDRYYVISLTAIDSGDISIYLPAGAVSASDSLSNTQSNTFKPRVLYIPNDSNWEIQSDDDWINNTDNSYGWIISNGMLEPLDSVITYSSIIHQFKEKMTLDSFKLTQSPIWDNWEKSENIGPPGAIDAPVLLTVADKDYYFFGQGRTGSYYAWHSTDMVNWIDGGKVCSGCYVTSAEYKDSVFYILQDEPNDEDPHLWIDSNVMDNKAGTFIGKVFDDPSPGSDAGLFRDDANGLFHIIYEDWTPINASLHHWDSPLAGHTSSLDCITGFTPHKHMPVVDMRTTFTGDTGYYHHSNGDYAYLIHEPEQRAFGDWTAIKVGNEYYLFSDYEKSEENLVKIARFHSSSIFKQFSLVGEMTTMHPDPTCGFAENQFYVISQYFDFISPGPWVPKVKVKVGVDINGDNKIDTWSNWSTIQENYRLKPGYARVVTKDAAQVIYDGLPAGYGFKFEIEVTDLTNNTSKPILDDAFLYFSRFSSVDEMIPVSDSFYNFSIQRHKEHIVVDYKLSIPDHIEISVFNILGKPIIKTVENQVYPGHYIIGLDVPINSETLLIITLRSLKTGQFETLKIL